MNFLKIAPPNKIRGIIMNFKKYFSNKTELILFILVASQLIALTVYNLFRLSYILDFDSAPALIQAVKSWEQKSLFINDWWYTTNLGWDTTIPLAALFYGIFHKIYFAYGLANNIILYAFLYIYYRICKRIKISRTGKLVVFLLLLTPYSIGQLDYMNMLLASQASYNIRALLTMMFISIMLEFYAGRTLRSQWAICFAFIVLLFTSSCSASIYALISCVIPIVIYVILNYIREDNFSLKCIKKPVVYFSSLSVVVACIGILISKYISMTDAIGGKAFTTGVHFGSNFINTLVGIFELLGGIKSDKSVAVLSAEGISLMLKLILIFLMLFSLYFIAKKNFRKHENDKFIEMSLALIIVNLGILIFVDTTYGSVTFEYRYLIIPVLPLFIYVGYLTDFILMHHNKSLKNIFFGGLISICMIVNIGLFSYAYSINDGYDQIKEIKADIDSQGIGLVNVIRDTAVQNEVDGKILKTMDDNQFIVSDGANVSWWVMSDTNLENNNYTGKTAILTQKNIFDSLPDYYKSHAILVKSFAYHNYNLYVLQTNRFDYISGFPKSDKRICFDFPYSYMYKAQNSVQDDNGILHSDGTAGTVLSGTIQALKGDYSVILHYSIENKSQGAGTVLLKDNDQVISSVQIEPGKTEAILDNISIDVTKTLNIEINVTEGTKIAIESIEYKRK